MRPLHIGLAAAWVKEQAGARQTGFTELPVTSDIAARVAVLAPHHKDPFDRLLVAQALALPARLLTADAKLGQYSELVWVEPP